jgi:hypothetical protein
MAISFGGGVFASHVNLSQSRTTLFRLHVMPTRTAHMHDEDAGGLIIIIEYGQECFKIDPIQVRYHGFGHYHSLLHPAVVLFLKWGSSILK